MSSLRALLIELLRTGWPKSMQNGAEQPKRRRQCDDVRVVAHRGLELVADFVDVSDVYLRVTCFGTFNIAMDC